MLDFFIGTFASNPALAIFLVALVPTLESKIAIPLGLTQAIWGELVLSPVSVFFLALAGSMLPAVFVIYIVKKIKDRTSGFVHDKFVAKLQKRYQSKNEKLGQKSSTFKKCFLLATFVAVPLPLTGVYTGSIIAGFTNLKLWQSLLTIFLGDVVSCLTMLLICTIFQNSILYILIFSVALVAIYLLVNLIVGICKRQKKEKR